MLTRIGSHRLSRFFLAMAISIGLSLVGPIHRNLTTNAIALEQAGDAPPEVGPPVVTDPTFSVFHAEICPTGRDRGEPVGEGYIFKITGLCHEGDRFAVGILDISDVMFPDGEIRFDVKVVTGNGRADFVVGFRDQRRSDRAHQDSYFTSIQPGLGRADLQRGDTILVLRRDLGAVLSVDNWNTVAIRASGADIWLLINGQVVAQATDSTFDRGKISFGLQRLGELDDAAETAAVVRNLQISRLANGDPSRAPTLLQSGQSPSPETKPSLPIALPAGVLWAENYDDPSSFECRAAEERPMYLFGCVDGEYQLVKRDPTSTGSVFVRLGAPNYYANSALAVDARLVGGFEQRFIGLGCRDQGPDHSGSYQFVIAPATRAAALMRAGDDGFDNLSGWRQVEAIRRGGEKNRLSIQCSGSTIRGLVNDIEFASVQDSTYQDGAMFFTVGPVDTTIQVEGRFDNAVITEQP